MSTERAPKKEVSVISHTRWDLILVALLLLLGALSFLFLRLFREEGAYAVVTVEGEEVARYALSEEGEYPILDGKNVLVIKSGGVSMYFADCPDRLCVSQGEIRYLGEAITCLPNRVQIYLEGAPSGEVDLESR